MKKLILAMLFCGSMTGTGSQAAGEPKRPNIVLMIADDMAWDDCGAYGNTKVRTPHIDRLAREGMRFDRAFVTASSCSPSRSSIITGRYPHNTGAEELHWPLPAEQVTFVEKLRAAGYWTAQAGKWHLGNAVKSRFDVVREVDASAFQVGTEKNAKAPLKAQGAGAAQSGCNQWVPILRDRPTDKPFFLWLAAVDPHRDYQPGTIPEPHRPEDVVVPPYLPDVSDVRKDLAAYYDEINRLDHYVGEVLAELDRQEIARDTMVLFLSDNGRPFPRCKTTLYDSGIRTPFIVRWPGHVRAGTRCGSLVSTIDIAPTVLRACGFEPGPTVQGKDLSPIFKDPIAKVRDLIFAERNWHDFAAHGRCARSAGFKYIKNDDHARALTPPADAVRSPTFQMMRRLRDAGKLTAEQLTCFVRPRPSEELYNVDADPHELLNLAGDRKYAEVISELRRALAQWTRETGDAEPEKSRPDEFDRETGDPLPNRVRPREVIADAHDPSPETNDASILAAPTPVSAQRPKSKKKLEADAPSVRMRLWVPAYYYPFGPGLREWNRLIASAKAVPIVAIVNPASGPGDHVDTNFAAVIPRARKAGLTLVGYIGTQYTRKPLKQVTKEVDTFLKFYPDLQGFHFDEQSSDARGVDYYAELYRYVHERIPGALVLTNPGTSCDRGYAARPASDVISLFERERGFDELQLPAWTSRFPGSRFCAQAHNVSTEEQMKRSLRRAAELKIGYVFITDDVGPNPYDRLPSYWPALVEAVRQLNLPPPKR
jgi:N-sulfoglucosamine sulfohydrolase